MRYRKESCAERIVASSGEKSVNKIFIEIYLDENVHVLIAKITRSHGFKAVITQEVGLKGLAIPNN